MSWCWDGKERSSKDESKDSKDRSREENKTKSGSVSKKHGGECMQRRVVVGPYVVGVTAKAPLGHEEGERVEGRDQEVVRIPQGVQEAFQAPCEER